MSGNEIELKFMSELPTELLFNIFSHLPAKQLVKCRGVCVRWKCIINGLLKSNILWQKYCRKDFKDVYQLAHQKSGSSLSWFNIYRSLTLWPQINDALEATDEFASASKWYEEIRSLQLLQDGELAVRTSSAIVYYNTETLKPSSRKLISGEYYGHAENYDTVVLTNRESQMFIVRKILFGPQYVTHTMFDNVMYFLIVRRTLYYVTFSNEVNKCELDDTKITNTVIGRTEDNIICLTFTDALHIITITRKIYSYLNQKLVLVQILDETSNLMYELHKYRFLDSMEWQIYINWLYLFKHNVPFHDLVNVVTVKVYGNVIFVGTTWGVLRIYYEDVNSTDFDFFQATPLKQYNFMERIDCPVLSLCPISQIDVMETENGHTVFVAMPKKIAVLKFTHNFKRSSSMALLPYAEVQNAKLLKIDS